ncbi:STAS domain-containing protein [Streptomyces sp. NPDC054950]
MSNIQNEDRRGRFSVKPEIVDGVLVVTVHGEIDHNVKDTLSLALTLEDGMTPPLRIVADLNVFIAAHLRVSQAQGWLRIAGAQETVLRLLQMVGVDTFIPCHPTIEQALNA